MSSLFREAGDIGPATIRSFAGLFHRRARIGGGRSAVRLFVGSVPDALLRFSSWPFVRFLRSEDTGTTAATQEEHGSRYWVDLRKRNYSIYDISRELREPGTPLGTTAVREILAAQGFAPLPRRLDGERPIGVGPTREAVADVRSFALSTGEFTTKVGALFLFIPDLIRLNFDALARSAKLPGSRMIPAEYSHQP
jgi:hypothetical protein